MANDGGEYDIIVVGAGPAGSTAARHAALAGRRVCLVERKPRVGFPVRCGEAFGIKGFGSTGIALDNRWIRAHIHRARLVAPDGTTVEYSRGAESYVVDRALMDHDLAQRAQQAGAALMLDSPVVGITRTHNDMYECLLPDKTIYARCVILSDGIESRCARDLGWNTAVKPSDIDCCAFGRIQHDSIPQNTCTFYFGSTVTPAGYAWVFPRGGNTANIGVGVLGSHTQRGTPLRLLNEFITRHFPSATITECHCGAAPAGQWVRPLVKDGAMLVGDAAQQIISLTGAGINYALHAGIIAGTCAAQAFSDGVFHYSRLKRYEQQWAKVLGKQQYRSYQLKEFLVKHTNDAFLNKIASSLTKKSRLSMTKVLLQAFVRNPQTFIRAFLFTR